jgi:photosystem II stability/assembly factor-like uncharacterized protein
MSRTGKTTAGVYRTTDGGEHWVRVLAPGAGRPGEIITSVELCPSDPNIAYAGGDRAIYRSTDAGQTWTLVSGGAQPWGPSGIEAGWPIDMQCDPLDTNRVFANNYNGGNFLSEDGGRTWQNASQGYTGAQVRRVAVDPENPARVYAAARSGLWRSDDGGTVWNGLYYPPLSGPGMSGLEWTTIVVDPAQSDHLLASQSAWPGTLIESKDGGKSWQYLGDVGSILGSTTSSVGFVNVIVFAPSDSSIAYGGVSIDYCALGHEMPYCTDDYPGAIIVSHDGGTTWQRVADRQAQKGPVIDLAVDPTNPQIVYAATANGLYKTVDGGTSWTLLGGLPGKTVRAVAVSPTDPQYVLVGIEAVGIYISADGGRTWRAGVAGLEANGSLHDIVFDPTNPQVVYASDYRSGVYRSTNGGRTWQQIKQGLLNRAALGLSISADGQHLYAAIDGGGVYRLDVNGIPPQPVTH